MRLWTYRGSEQTCRAPRRQLFPDEVIRAASAAAENAAAFSMTRERILSCASELRFRCRPPNGTVTIADPRSRSPACRGTTQIRGVCAPFCPPMPLCEGCVKLTLTLTATRGRA
jgi:hypothetical protein